MDIRDDGLGNAQVPLLPLNEMHQKSPAVVKNKLGTFIGVFVPTTLSMMGGVIIFIKLGWFVAQAGLLETLSMAALSIFLLLSTGLSIAAIATNGSVKGGGPYFMISRTLGPEFGGSFGLVFYIANTLSVAFSIVGFGEEIATMMNVSKWERIGIEMALLLLLVGICIIGAVLFTKMSMALLSVLSVSLLLCFFSLFSAHPDASIGFTGPNSETFSSNLTPNYQPGVNYATVFGIMFASVTGVMAGANLSGDLKSPSSSIPRGTIYSLFITFSMYIAIIVGLSATVTREQLYNNLFILKDTCYSSVIFTIGYYTAIFSSVVPGMSGSARILQALARDKLIPGLNVFSYGSKKGDEPRVALLLTLGLNLVLLIVDSINTIASYSAMAFLACYTIVNLACFLLAATGAQNFRPRFKFFSRYVALLGAIGCVVMMLAISPLSASVAVAFLAGIFLWILSRSPQIDWGDISYAILFHQIRKQLLSLDKSEEHVKYWRPQILLLVNDVPSSTNLCMAVNDMKKGGLYILGHVLVSDTVESANVMTDEWHKTLRTHASQLKFKAFTNVIVAPTFRWGTLNLVMTTGLSFMKPNSIAMKIPEPNSQRVLSDEMAHILSDLSSINKSILLCRNFESLERPIKDRKLSPKDFLIDIMVSATSSDFEHDPSTSLAVVLAWSLSVSHKWKGLCTIRLVAFCDTSSNIPGVAARINDFMASARVDADILVLPTSEVPELEGHSVRNLAIRQRFVALNNLYKRETIKSKIVFIPASIPTPCSTDFVTSLQQLTQDLPPCVVVHSNKTVITTEL